MGATPGHNKERKKALERSHKIRCGFCPYHENENATFYSRAERPKAKGKKPQRGGKRD